MDYLIIVLLGLAIGSFLNVCIFRLPKGESIVAPRSHCPKCKHILRWYENIPVLSYVFLRGKCLRCKQKISFIYPMIEMLTCFLALILYLLFGLNFKTLIYFVFFASLIVVAFIDLDIQEIPDIISIPGIVLGLIISIIYPELLGATRMESFLNSLFGILVGGGSLYLIGFLGEIIFKKESMGGGDIKLLAMIGAFIGWKLTVLTFFIAPFFGSITGIIAKLREGKEMIPYGPYLALASFISFLCGDFILKMLFTV